MSNDERLRNIDLANPSYLIVSSPEIQPQVANLKAGSSVFVGSGANCKVVLPDENVKQIHCMIWLEPDRTLKVQDWNTGTTFLNEAPVDEEATMRSGDIVTIGNHRLTAVLDAEFHESIAVELLNGGGSLPTEPVASEAFVDVKIRDADQDKGWESHQSANELVAGPQHSFNAGVAEGPSVENKPTGGFEYDLDADFDDRRTDAPGSFDFSYGTPEAFDSNDGFAEDADDETSMLRMEIEQLRFELADRESQIESLQVNNNGSNQEIDEAETLKLVTRLEDLLEELQSSDGRIRGMEELLRVSDHATQAEQEERQELERWVAEIEKRLGDREAETQAELSRLAKRLESAQQESAAAETQLQTLAQTESGADGQQAAVVALSEQVEQLRSKLQEANQENARLQDRPVRDEADADLADKLKQTEAEFVKLRVEYSQERAEMARRHAELEGIRDELEDRLRNGRSVDQSDTRIRAMRDHLKEIHAKEQAEKDEQKASGLGGRIANLLTRLR
jgi:hypothetical protein